MFDPTFLYTQNKTVKAKHWKDRNISYIKKSQQLIKQNCSLKVKGKTQPY